MSPFVIPKPRIGGVRNLSVSFFHGRPFPRAARLSENDDSLLGEARGKIEKIKNALPVSASKRICA
jgi:hypothetical protein